MEDDNINTDLAVEQQHREPIQGSSQVEADVVHIRQEAQETTPPSPLSPTFGSSPQERGEGRSVQAATSPVGEGTYMVSRSDVTPLPHDLLHHDRLARHRRWHPCLGRRAVCLTPVHGRTGWTLHLRVSPRQHCLLWLQSLGIWQAAKARAA